MSFRLRVVTVSAGIACMMASVAPVTYGATPITVTSQAATDGPIQYTVKVTSKAFGNAQDTRTIRSGQSDDYTWKTVPPGGPVSATEDCPDYSSLPVDANGAMIRQIQVRVAPVVAKDGVATVQMSFQAQTPKGTKSVTANGKTLTCPNATTFSQILHFTMPTNGSVKTVALSDGTQVAVSAKR
jgi:hypothetical protein